MPIEDAWAQQRQLSMLATRSRAALDRNRQVNLGLLIAGAALGVLATQSVWISRWLAIGIGIVATVVLGTAASIQASALNRTKIEQWRTARAASESLKGIIWQYRAGVAPFSGADPDLKLEERLAAMSERIGTIHELWTRTPPDGQPLPTTWWLTIDDYVRDRADEQRTWHLDRVERLQRSGARAERFRRVELLATLVATPLALVGALTEHLQWLAPWAAVVTTVGAVSAAYLARNADKRIATSYLELADDLAVLISDFDPTVATEADAAAFVAAVERRIARQNDGWASMLTVD